MTNPLMPNITPTILAGGKGLRLRPLTSKTHPKPFVKAFSKYSFLQKTVLRVKNFNPPIIICNASHIKHVQDELNAINIQPRHIIAEPKGKSTAPAIALANLLLEPKEQMLILPCDHAIKNDHSFATHITQTIQENPSCTDKILIFGSKTKSPITRYGYIKTASLPNSIAIKSVEKFTEKPNKQTAQTYIESGKHYWNTGIFTCTAKTLKTELNTYSQDIIEIAKSCLTKDTTNIIIKPDPDIFTQFPNISIDRALMEHTQNALITELKHSWSDTGTWGALILSKCVLF